MSKRRIFLLSLVLLMGLMSYLIDTRPAMAVTLPDGFEHEVVTSTPSPIALAFTPDGRLLITSREGQVRVWENGNLSTALNIDNIICSDQERGLLGIAVDPNFGEGTNRYVYLYFTKKVGPGCEGAGQGNEVSRVSRFVLSKNNTIDPASEERLIDNIPSPGFHNAGDLHFGKDGYLYISTGDGGCDYAARTRCQYENDASRDRNVLLGKILRIEPDGGIPPSNPFTGSGNQSARCNETGRTTAQNCRETFAMGLRNPFRIAFDPDASGTNFRINDVGGANFEEINKGEAGADYGWNVREGRCAAIRKKTTDCGGAPPRMTDPIYAYHHDTGCTAITDAAFVPDGAWSASYNDSYLFGDYVCGKIFELTRKANGDYTRSAFAENLGKGGPVSMTFGPSGKALYYTTFDGGGEVRRIGFTSGNRKPVAVAEGDPNNWSEDLRINLTGAESSDPDGDLPLTYRWDFTSNGSWDDSGATVSPVYSSPGKYTATLEVRDSKGATSTDTIEVFPGNTPPDPVVELPDPFAVGEELTLRASATDAEDGQLPDSALRWEVLRHHDGSHTHPWASGTGNRLTFTAPPPEDPLSTDPDKNFLEVRLTATDELGLSTTQRRSLRPHVVDVMFETVPTGFRLGVNGVEFNAPRTFRSWEDYKLNLNAPQQQHNGRTWVFKSWSDGRNASHTVTTPATPITYTATFERQ